MHAVTSKSDQGKISASRQPQAQYNAHLSLPHKSHGHDTEALSQMLASNTSGKFTGIATSNSKSGHLQRLIQRASIQPKLRISQPGDRFEEEADQNAERVMTQTSGDHQRAPDEPASQNLQTNSHIQPQAEEEEDAQPKALMPQAEEEEEAQPKSLMPQEEEEEEAQPKALMLQEEEEEQAQSKSLMPQAEEEEEAQPKALMPQEKEEVQANSVMPQEEEEELQAKALMPQEEEEEIQAESLMPQEEEEQESIQAKGSTDTAVNSAFQDRLHSTAGAGSPLPKSSRNFMENRFGRDFSNVRVHTGSEAVQLTSEIGAQAFTYGRNIYFNQGRFNSDSSQGKWLLAHELSHTVQQGASPAIARGNLYQPTIQRQEAAAEEVIDVEAEIAASEEAAAAAVDPKPAEQAKKQADQKESPEADEQEIAEKPAEESAKKAPKKAAPPKGRKRPVVFMPAKKEEEEPKGEVGQYLEQESAGVCGQAAGKAQVLADNEKNHDDAGQKLKQTEESVVPPEQEGQSQSNAEQVDDLDQASAPEPDEQKAKDTMTAELEKAVPRKIKQLNEFKSKGKAKVVGSKVLGKVKEDTNAVQGTYNKIEKAPAPKPKEREPVELPSEETVPETEKLNLGRGAVPPIKEEHTDLTEFDQKSDKMMEQEGITDDQLKMVDEGDLFEARKERDGLKQKVVEQPAQIREFAQNEVNKVEKDLQQKEKSSKTQMRNQRMQGLAATQAKQKKTKTALELKREAVTKKINAIYQTAKSTVTTKLNNLEKDSLAAFDRGQAKASAEFENEVKSDVNAWKRKRYSGFWGPAKWLKDKLVGIDHFPEIKRAFEKGKSNFIAKIDNLILSITKASHKVIKDCREELQTARKDIKVYVDGLGPALKATGRQTMTEMKTKLAEMDKFIDRKKKELARKLCDKKDEAIKKIDEKIEKMKEEMSGALSKLGNLLLGALLKFFKWALKKAGYNANQLMGIINKGKAVIKKIVGDPIRFIMNIVDAVKTGIFNFQKNIKKHLIGGLINWLTGAMGDIGIELPAKFDLKGILSMVLQILGLTWASIRRKLVRRLGEKVVGTVEKTVDIVKKIITEGPMALWKMIKAKAAEIKNQVMEGIRNWVITEVVKQGIITLVSFLNPAGAIIQAILAIYNTVMFFVENWDRIVTFVKTVFNSIADIAMGKISAAAAAVERALAMTIPIILNFIARLARISGIGKAVRNIILKIRKPIDKIVNKAVDFIVKKAKRLFKKGKAAVKKGVAKVKSWFTAPFKMAGKQHKFDLIEKDKKARIVMRSKSGADILSKLNKAAGTPNLKPEIQNEIKDFQGRASEIITLGASSKARDKKRAKAKLLDLSMRVQKFGATHGFKDLYPLDNADHQSDLDKWEFKVGSYNSLKGKGKEMTADHEPQDAVMKNIKNIRIEVPAAAGPPGTTKQKKVFGGGTDVSKYTKGKGMTMNMFRPRHMETRTYGPSGSKSRSESLEKMGIKNSADSKGPFISKENTVDKAKAEVRSGVIWSLNQDLAKVESIYKNKKWKFQTEDNIASRLSTAQGQVRSHNKTNWKEVF